MEKLQKAFVGVVHEPGITHNIQPAFHRQGYFGVKVTPLGANLPLLEGYDDGEVKALMEDAKGWMDQWFKEIRSWCPNDLDVERTICTMDVARVMIRTSCQQIIDEFINVKVNGDIYHLRVLEDSYGPTRIMIPQKNGNEGRDSSVELEEDEEEEARRMWTEGDIEERESEEVGAGGPQHTSNTNLSITCGVVRNETQSAEVGCLQNSLVSEGGREGHRTGGVYNDGPRNVYLKLTKTDPIAEEQASSCHSMSEFNGVTRNPPLKHRSGRKPTSSLSSAGEVLCCSSLSSSGFLNCNQRFMEKYDQESAQKLWQGAVVLGVEGEESGERRGCRGSVCLSERSEFSLFIEAMEVIDIPILGKKFTWFNSDGSTMSRLDRFLLSEGFIHKGGISNQWIGDRDISDYFPIWLECSNLNWGPKPFKFNNCWVDHPEFLDLVKNIWVQSNMKRLKEALKKWNRDVFGFKDLCIDKTLRELNEVEDLIANGDVDPVDLNSKELVRKFWEQIHSKESLLRKKSRTKWIQEGDSNSHFFRSSIKGRHRRNQIVMLKKGEAWLEGVTTIKKEVKDHFVKLLSEHWNSRPFLQGVDFKSLSFDDNSFLLAPFDEAEVKQTMWSCDGVGKINLLLSNGFSTTTSDFRWGVGKRRKDNFLLFKVDFERAYDTVSWGFLERMMSKMGFSEGWLKWMRACIFESSMSILVNGSPTEDFKVGRGRFRGYKINPNLHFQLLQFADDTTIMGEGSWENFWTIKSMLRGFELVFDLKINFVKSKLYDINVGARLLEAGATFLACNTATVPFKFLGIAVGANPRRRETWKPVVEAMTKRLNSWHSRHLSFGGGISLINSVLASIPLYFFSFFRAPCCVLKSIEKIQRNFLWGGSAEERKICWVKWDQIWLPKVKGGLGVKNLELFNLALLSKWKWRFLNHNNAIWADLLRYRYGHLPSILLSGLDITSNAHSSLWWCDIICPGRGMSDSLFKSNISCRVGNGNNIGFWQFKWYGNQPFCDIFPNLYAKEAIKNVMVYERLRGTGSVSLWRWNWSKSLSENEAQQLTELQGLFDGFSLHNNNHDQWRWIPDSNGLFTVKGRDHFLLFGDLFKMKDKGRVRYLPCNNVVASLLFLSSPSKHVARGSDEFASCCQDSPGSLGASDLCSSGEW
ncbi:hypothetical protein TSUD_377390 [Trifolium subterraneum]|uniref:Reverse transcriptase domain-containing protein n=1 Tax=Trifolium subterraneum TaxID=3900 RepID=A0A2Z6P1C3_TRISU|nr:hypothetical protein TSUD_377390 [Trifolium subterraneum]